MITFEVKDMTCGHCVSTITNALKDADKDAKVQVDFASHRVQIEPREANASELRDAIKAAGYTPVQVSGATAAVPVERSTGSCCGSRKPASVDAGQTVASATGTCCG